VRSQGSEDDLRRHRQSEKLGLLLVCLQHRQFPKDHQQGKRRIIVMELTTMPT
jgi:hypothetical protein